MPRCFSTSIQSDVAWRALLRPFTVPASWIAPPKSRSFSVSVVLPASGWEMIAKVRRLATSRRMSGGKALSVGLSCRESLVVLAVMLIGKLSAAGKQKPPVGKMKTNPLAVRRANYSKTGRALEPYRRRPFT